MMCLTEAQLRQHRMPDYLESEPCKRPRNVLLRKGEANLAKASVVNVSQFSRG